MYLRLFKQLQRTAHHTADLRKNFEKSVCICCSGRGPARGRGVGGPPGLAPAAARGGGRVGGRGQGPPPRPRAPPVPVPREDFNFEEAFQKFKKEARSPSIISAIHFPCSIPFFWHAISGGTFKASNEAAQRSVEEVGLALLPLCHA